MHNEFTAIVERDEGWFIAYCPEIPGANGQGKSKAEAIKSLSEAIDLILEDRREDAIRGLPADAERELVAVGCSATLSSNISAATAAISSGKVLHTPCGAIL